MFGSAVRPQQHPSALRIETDLMRTDVVFMRPAGERTVCVECVAKIGNADDALRFGITGIGGSGQPEGQVRSIPRDRDARCRPVVITLCHRLVAAGRLPDLKSEVADAQGIRNVDGLGEMGDLLLDPRSRVEGRVRAERVEAEAAPGRPVGRWRGG